MTLKTMFGQVVQGLRSGARHGREALGHLGDRTGSVNVTLGPFTATLWPARQVGQEPHVAKTVAPCAGKLAPATCLRCGKAHDR